MLLAVTTIVRGAPLTRPAGWLRIVDLAAGEQVALAPMPDAVSRPFETNPRGGVRGGRGIVAAPGRLGVAIDDRVIVLDPSWRVTSVISHRLMGAVHDLAEAPGGFWAACADGDLVLRMSWDGQLVDTWEWVRDSKLRRALGHAWLPGVSGSQDYRAHGGLHLDAGHLNAVAADGDTLWVGLGRLRPPDEMRRPVVRVIGTRLAGAAGLGRIARRVLVRRQRQQADERGPDTLHLTTTSHASRDWSWAVVEVSRDRSARVVARHPSGGLPTHNAVPFDGFVAVAESASGRLVALDRRSGAIARSVELAGGPPFPRGLLHLGGGRFVVGTQRPAALNVVDLLGELVESRILLPDDRGESTYAIAAVPDEFDDPAGRLPTTRAGWGIVGGDASDRAFGRPLAR